MTPKRQSTKRMLSPFGASRLEAERERLAKIRTRFNHWKNILRPQYPEAMSWASLEISKRAEDDNPRHYAFTEFDDSVPSELKHRMVIVTVSPRLGDLIDDKIDGIILHELGHVIDFIEPSMAPVKAISEHDQELRADKIIETSIKVRILYDPEDMLETVGQGVRRPKGLR